MNGILSFLHVHNCANGREIEISTIAHPTNLSNKQLKTNKTSSIGPYPDFTGLPDFIGLPDFSV
jgi:hypothetical protein